MIVALCSASFLITFLDRRSFASLGREPRQVSHWPFWLIYDIPLIQQWAIKPELISVILAHLAVRPCNLLLPSCSGPFNYCPGRRHCWHVGLVQDVPDSDLIIALGIQAMKRLQRRNGQWRHGKRHSLRV